MGKIDVFKLSYGIGDRVVIYRTAGREDIRGIVDEIGDGYILLRRPGARKPDAIFEEMVSGWGDDDTPDSRQECTTVQNNSALESELSGKIAENFPVVVAESEPNPEISHDNILVADKDAVLEYTPEQRKNEEPIETVKEIEPKRRDYSSELPSMGIKVVGHIDLSKIEPKPKKRIRKDAESQSEAKQAKNAESKAQEISGIIRLKDIVGELGISLGGAVDCLKRNGYSVEEDENAIIPEGAVSALRSYFAGAVYASGVTPSTSSFPASVSDITEEKEFASSEEDHFQEYDNDDEDDGDDEDDMICDIDITQINSDSMLHVKHNIWEIFSDILAQSGVLMDATTPVNAVISRSEGPKIFATLNNGNVVRFTNSKLVGFNNVREKLIGCKLFCTGNGAQDMIAKCKCAMVQMTYSQLSSVVEDALKKENFMSLKRICKTVKAFPEMNGCQQLFFRLFATLWRLKELKSIISSEESLSDNQKQKINSYISEYLEGNKENPIQYASLRIAIIEELGFKVSKIYLQYLVNNISNEVKKKGPLSSATADTGGESNVIVIPSSVPSFSKDDEEKILSDSLIDYKQMILASGLRPNALVSTNATYLGDSDYSTDLGIALTKDGNKVFIRKMGFVGDATIHLKKGSSLYVKYRSTTGDSVTSIGQMTYNALNKYYANSIKDGSLWGAISILTYLLHSVPEVESQKETIRSMSSKLITLAQTRYAKQPIAEISGEHRLWLETFIRQIVETEKKLEPISDNQIKDLFLHRFDILLPTAIITQVRSEIGIDESEARLKHYNQERQSQSEAAIFERNEELFLKLESVFNVLSIDLESLIPTNATLLYEGLGAGIKAKTDDGKIISIQGEFYIGNPMSLISSNVRVFTRAQTTGVCFITIEEMTFGNLLEFCHTKIKNGCYQEIVNISKALRSMPIFSTEDDSLKAIYTEARRNVKKEINKNIRTYEELSEEEIAVISSFVKESIETEDGNSPLSDFQIANSYNIKFGVLLHTSVISTIRKDLKIGGSVERRIEASPMIIESNCLIDKYFAWYNNGAAYNSTYPEIRFKDENVDPVLLSELKNYRRGDPAIAAICDAHREGRYIVASFVARPCNSNELYQTARYFETAGNLVAAQALKDFIATKIEMEIPSKNYSFQSLYTKAREARKAHDYAAAEDILKNLIRANYQLDTVVKDLADMYREIGNLNQSLLLMEENLELLENKQKAYNFISNLYTASGNYEKSIFYLRKAYELIDVSDKESRVRCLINIANQSIVLKDTESAKEVLNQALEIKFNKEARRRLDELLKDKKSGIGKLTRVLSFRAPLFLENDLKLSNYQTLSNDAYENLIKAKDSQEKLDQERYRKSIISYAQARYIDLLKSDKVYSAQEYMLCVQSINNTIVTGDGMKLLLSEIMDDPIELAEKTEVQDFPAFLATYTPTSRCERVFYAFLKCFDSQSLPNVLNYLFDNPRWNSWICNLIGKESLDRKIFRDTIIKKADASIKQYEDVCFTLDGVKQLDNSYDMSDKVLSLFDEEHTKNISEGDKLSLSKLCEVIQSVNAIQKIDDYEMVEGRVIGLKKNINDAINRILEEPTRVSALHIAPVFDKCAHLLDSIMQKLSDEKSPEISIVASSNARISDGSCSLQMKLSNKTGHSKIVSASVRIVNINGRDVTNKQYMYNLRSPLYGGCCNTFEIIIDVEPDDIKQRIIMTKLDITYYDKDSREQMTSCPLNIRVDDSKSFKPYENKFMKYANGDAVKDIDMVKGRDRLINTISQTAQEDNKSFVIYGQRRSGKSTVLFHVKKKIEENRKYFVADMSMLSLSGKDNQIVNEQSYLGDLYFLILSKIARQIKLENRDVHKKVFGYGLNCDDFLSNPNMKFTEYLERVKDVLHDDLGYEDDRIILIIDEFTVLYYEILEGTITDSFIKKMKELSESRSITFIVSGHDVMPKFWEKYPNEFGIFKKEPVTSIDELSARELVERPVWDTENDKSRFEYDAVSRIIELAGCIPFFIQILCAEIVNYAIINKIPVITEFDVNKVVNLMTSSEAKLRRGDFDNLVPVGENRKYHEKVFEISLDEVDTIMREISQFELDYVSINNLHSINKTDIEKVLSYLISRGVLEEHPEYGRNMVKIKVSLFKQWLRKNP